MDLGDPQFWDWTTTQDQGELLQLFPFTKIYLLKCVKLQLGLKFNKEYEPTKGKGITTANFFQGWGHGVFWKGS